MNAKCNDICNDSELAFTSTNFIRVYIMWKIVLPNNKTFHLCFINIAYNLLQYTSILLQTVFHNTQEL